MKFWQYFIESFGRKTRMKIHTDAHVRETCSDSFQYFKTVTAVFKTLVRSGYFFKRCALEDLVTLLPHLLHDFKIFINCAFFEAAVDGSIDFHFLPYRLLHKELPNRYTVLLCYKLVKSLIEARNGCGSHKIRGFRKMSSF